jgi:acetyl esterase/lipase
VLDSVRAARRVVTDTSDRAAVFGHSQGGHAAVFADQIADTYAPDIDLVGVAAMAPPTDLATLVLADDHEALGIVLTALAIDSWSRVYPDAQLASIVHEPARTLVHDMSSRCIENSAQAYTQLLDVVGLQVDFLSGDPTVAPGWREHFAENSPGDLPTDVPVLVAQGLADDLVRPHVTEAYVEHQCDRGVPIELDTYAGVSHFGVRRDAADRVTDWLLARLAGQPAPSGCSTHAETPPPS